MAIADYVIMDRAHTGPPPAVSIWPPEIGKVPLEGSPDPAQSWRLTTEMLLEVSPAVEDESQLLHVFYNATTLPVSSYNYRTSNFVFKNNKMHTLNLVYKHSKIFRFRLKCLLICVPI